MEILLIYQSKSVALFLGFIFWGRPGCRCLPHSTTTKNTTTRLFKVFIHPNNRTTLTREAIYFSSQTVVLFVSTWHCLHLSIIPLERECWNCNSINVYYSTVWQRLVFLVQMGGQNKTKSKQDFPCHFIVVDPVTECDQTHRDTVRFRWAGVASQLTFHWLPRAQFQNDLLTK